MREALIQQAEEKAAGILEEASREQEQEKTFFEENRSAVSEKILRHLLREV